MLAMAVSTAVGIAATFGADRTTLQLATMEIVAA